MYNIRTFFELQKDSVPVVSVCTVFFGVSRCRKHQECHFFAVSLSALLFPAVRRRPSERDRAAQTKRRPNFLLLCGEEGAFDNGGIVSPRKPYKTGSAGRCRRNEVGSSLSGLAIFGLYSRFPEVETGCVAFTSKPDK